MLVVSDPQQLYKSQMRSGEMKRIKNESGLSHSLSASILGPAVQASLGRSWYCLASLAASWCLLDPLAASLISSLVITGLLVRLGLSLRRSLRSSSSSLSTRTISSAMQTQFITRRYSSVYSRLCNLLEYSVFSSFKFGVISIL